MPAIGVAATGTLTLDFANNLWKKRFRTSAIIAPASQPPIEGGFLVPPNMSPILSALFYSEEPPEGYRRRFTSEGVLFKSNAPRSRWDFLKFPTCKIEPCGGCGRMFPPTALYSGSFPNTKCNRPYAEWVEGIDHGPGSHRHVCRGCANRYDALRRRWHLWADIGRLIRRLEREITNARKQAA